MERLHTAVAACVAALLFGSTASGYYHYIHFAGRTGPFTPIPEKYDIGALRNKTVPYFISEQGPAQFAAGDSFAGLVSQIQLAAKTWNDIPGSDLRVAFGGFSAAATVQNGPGIDVVFADDIPPGVWALGGVTSVANPVTPAGGAAFVPILRGMVRMPVDMREAPSFTERAFMVMLHEFGHALGLQHTFTSGTMSTEITRGTTRAKPLSDDDAAGMAVLYPTSGFLSQSGAVSGRVTAGGVGVNLASVVAISATGPAVSTLTNPDGSYTIQGIPAGTYYLYVHPLPPALNGEATPGAVVPPKGPDGVPFPVIDFFETLFYPGTRDVNAASQFSFSAGDAKTGVNFNVARRSAPAVSSVTTYGYYGSVAVNPAPIVGNTNGAVLVARGTGLVNSANALAPGLSVYAFGDSGVSIEPTSVKYYTAGYIRFDVYPGFGWSPGSRHLLFATRDDLYVLPSSLLLVSNRGPAITSVRPFTDERGARLALIAGNNFDLTTRFFFDGIQAQVARTAGDGVLVIPPAAPSGHKANVIALNGDGQSSLIAQPGGGPVYTYDPADMPVISISPAVLAAGSEAMVEVTGANNAFANGQTELGLGSSDIAVRRIWVVGPNRLLANISVSALAQTGSSHVTVLTGLQGATLPRGFQVTAANPRQLNIIPPVVNQANGSPSVAAGGIGILTVSNLTLPAGALTLTISDVRANILSVNQGQITFQAPAGLAPGPAIVRLQTAAGDSVLPVVIDIDPLPPSIMAAFSSPGALADPFHPAVRGTVFAILVSGLPEAALSGDPRNVKVTVGGVEHAAFSAAAQTGGVLVQVNLSMNVAPGSQVPVTVAYNNVSSSAFAVSIK